MSKEITIEDIKNLKGYKKLLKSIREDDSEAAHIYYDDLIQWIALHYAPDVVKELNELVENVSFWYA